MSTPPLAERIEVHGVVQGVGFRPMVHRLATSLGLDGHVGNDSSRVFIEVQGAAPRIDELVQRLRRECPPLARIDRIERQPVRPEPAYGFRIVESRAVEGGRTPVPPDTAVCDACLEELFDPSNRRYRHPFINCTDCGPRFTIIRELPYDRPRTTMEAFPMCPACREEYENPADRRYHAQPVACPDCGPTLTWRDANLTEISAPDPIERAVRALQAGRIVAIKGIGGYHLACRADDDGAVRSLRKRKHRPEKPFGVMVADLDQARRLAHVCPDEADLLQSSAAPIVLLRAREANGLSRSVAPGNPLLGLMLPYTPLHHLLLAGLGRPLVLTSANPSGEPLVHRLQDLESLAGLYDAVLDHDRPIQTPCDDSVVRLVGGKLLPIRRARGYAPLPVPLDSGGRAVLAVGAELKNTCCVAADGRAWVSAHIGDMENLATLRSFEHNAEHLGALYEVRPELVAADAHPGYRGSIWAREHHGERLVQVQHHHAHIASVMAEHGLDPQQEVLGFAFDGTGYGDDGTIWGGEVLLARAADYRRIGHLQPVPLPGGDAAVRNPCRVALAYLHGAGIEWSDDLAPVAALHPAQRELLRQQLAQDIGCVPTTSMGRLFDAVASLLGLRQTINYEAQAAIDLEIAAQRHTGDSPSYRFALREGVLDPQPVFQQMIRDLRAGLPAEVLARSFHSAVADAVADVARDAADTHGVRIVALSGGVFQNALLTEACTEALQALGLDVRTHSVVPPNDAGLALGQAYVAAHRARRSEEKPTCA